MSTLLCHILGSRLEVLSCGAFEIQLGFVSPYFELCLDRCCVLKYILRFFFVQATFQQFQKRYGGVGMVINKEQDNNLLLSIFQCCDIRILTVCFKLLRTIVQHLKRDKAGNGKLCLMMNKITICF